MSPGDFGERTTGDVSVADDLDANADYDREATTRIAPLSCQKPSRPLIRMMARMIAASVDLASTAEMSVATTRIRMIRLSNWRISRRSVPPRSLATDYVGAIARQLVGCFGCS